MTFDSPLSLIATLDLIIVEAIKEFSADVFNILHSLVTTCRYLQFTRKNSKSLLPDKNYYIYVHFLPVYLPYLLGIYFNFDTFLFSQWNTLAILSKIVNLRGK